MYKQDHGRHFPFNIIVIGTAFAVAGVFTARSYPVLGTIFLLIGVITWFARQGIRIDTEKRRYQEYVKLLGVYLTSWESLPEIKHISVARPQTALGASAKAFLKENPYHVNIIGTKEEKIFVIDSEDKSRAFGLARDLAERLGVSRILDGTEKEERYIHV